MKQHRSPVLPAVNGEAPCRSMIVLQRNVPLVVFSQKPSAERWVQAPVKWQKYVKCLKMQALLRTRMCRFLQTQEHRTFLVSSYGRSVFTLRMCLPGRTFLCLLFFQFLICTLFCLCLKNGLTFSSLIGRRPIHFHWFLPFHHRPSEAGTGREFYRKIAFPQRHAGVSKNAHKALSYPWQ